MSGKTFAHVDGFSPSFSSQCSRTLRGVGNTAHRNRFAISDSSLCCHLLCSPLMAVALGTTNYLWYGQSLPMPVEQTSTQPRVTQWAPRGRSCWHQQLSQTPVITFHSSSQQARLSLVSGGKWLGYGGKRRWKGPCRHHYPHVAFSSGGESWRSSVFAAGTTEPACNCWNMQPDGQL